MIHEELSWGRLSHNQTSAVRDIVKDKVVYDLGAGSCALACAVANLGASKVIAVDTPDALQCIRIQNRKVELRALTFSDLFYSEDFPEGAVALLSWPVNHWTPMLVEVLSQMRQTIYLGKNADRTQCGTKKLWTYLRGLDHEHYIPHPDNDLIVYNNYRARTGKQRPSDEGVYIPSNTLPHERAALRSWIDGSPMESWTDIHPELRP